ncbi:succinylglutamate desuccinylase/aspartoacylase family protein [Paenirhodobacter sp.]|uniref:succinylglutamate desuccinylase/aspartoacylase family protein n=1 Tax=Paenirhodobacter sp. TaxID=1965326 RepID=UPI003B3C8314
MDKLEFPLPGSDARITAFRYGTPGARPKAYLQAGLHADEFPGMLALHLLRGMLERAGDRITGEIVILPQANPLGLEQHPNGFLYGRHDSASGQNFNRGYPDLAPALADLPLGPDAAQNVAMVRDAMGAALAAMQPETALDAMRHRLMVLAHDADLVLDLHADNQALPHMYTGTPLWPDAQDIAAEIDARAVLLAEVSGGNPFDEALSGPWWALARARPEAAVPSACLAATLELGSNDDVDLRLAEDQAAALYRILERRGMIEGNPGRLPGALCEATPLTAMAQVKAPAGGLIAYHRQLGDTLRAGEVVATIIDPLGTSVEVTAETDGILFARHSQPYAWPGKVIGKIAGASDLAHRRGLLLTD